MIYFLKVISGILVFVFLYTSVRAFVLIQRSKVLVEKSQRYEKHVEGATDTFLFIGDSTTVGTGSADPVDTISGRFSVLYPEVNIINQGINGQKIHELAQNFSSSSYSNINLIVIQIGANDIIRLTPEENIKADLDLLLQKATQLSKKVVILHSGNVGAAPFFPRYLGWIWTWKAKKVRDLYINEAKKYNVKYVDLFQKREDDIFLTDVNKYYADDYLHPSGEGYKIWFDKIKTEVGSFI